MHPHSNGYHHTMIERHSYCHCDLVIISDAAWGCPHVENVLSLYTTIGLQIDVYGLQ